MCLILENYRLVECLLDFFLAIEAASFIKKSNKIVQLIVHIAVVDSVP